MITRRNISESWPPTKKTIYIKSRETDAINLDMQECEQPQIEVILSVAVLHCLPNLLKWNHLASVLLRRVGRLRGTGCCSRFHEAADFLRRASLHIVGDVCVGVQRKSCAEMAQHTGQGFYIHAAGDSHGRECVPLRYNNDKQKKPLFSRGLSVCRLLFNSFSKLKIDENYKEKRRLFY